MYFNNGLEIIMRNWIGKKVIVVGAARQGVALTRFLLQKGAHVLLNDRQPIEKLSAARKAFSDLPENSTLEWVCGGHPLEILDGADLMCLSGGIPLTLPLVVEAQRRAIPLSNDSQIFMQVVPCPVIGITGSAGKTTTTTLVGRIANAGLDEGLPDLSYNRVWVGGNIGLPLISLVDQISMQDIVVMELSSFQLEIMDLSPQVAAVLNITPNHLDRHKTMVAYTAAKMRILAYQSKTDIAVLGRDDPRAWELAQAAPGHVISFGFSHLAPGGEGVYFLNDTIYLRRSGHQDRRLIARHNIALRGEHNLLNVMAAAAIATAAGVPDKAVSLGVKGFKGVPHRLEYVRSWGGSDWYNDSIATAPERTIAAIRSFDEPLVLLAGGRDKKLPWEEFARLVSQRVDHLILFGEAAETIEKEMQAQGSEYLIVKKCSNLQQAVQTAARVVEPGDVVLLSPGGTSFDEFIDFEERGRCFVQWVNELP
jgi:UDP-N-acetylmuramoylalanine--D-glutamate ligase